MHKDCDKHYFKKPEFYRITGGNNYVRIDAEDKVTGHGKYVGDIMFPDMLTGKMVRSPHAYARIKSIDVSKAKALPGVKAILTAKDFEWKCKVGNAEFAAEFADKEVLCSELVKQVGDDVAAVCAVDEETAQKAVDLIKVEYEVLKGVFDPFEAMKDGAPEIQWEGRGMHNIGMKSVMKAGTDVEEEFANAAHVQHRDYKAHRMVHAAMEPHGAVADYRNGIYTIWMSTQMAFVDQYWYARCLGVTEKYVRVIKPLVGGGFGGKLDSYSFGLCAAKMAEMTGRPVRMILSREEVFQSTRNRHPIYMHIDSAFGKDGKLLAKKCYHVLDGGPYGGSGVAACAQSTLWANFPYKINGVDFLAHRVYTNNPSAGAMRGYTACQVHYAHDLNMQYAADQMGIDPVEFRKISAADSGYVAPAGLAITSCAYKETLDTAAKEIGWYERKKEMAKGEGIGFAGTGFVSGTGFAVLETPNQSSACVTVRINKCGIATLSIGSHDIGQGSDTVMTAIVAEELGLEMIDVKTFMSDTFLTPFDSGSYGSRVTFLAGNAARRAAVDAKRQLLEVIAPMWGVMPQTLECLEGQVISKEKAELRMPFREAMFKYMTIKGGDELIGIGSYYHRTDNSQYNGVNTTNYAPAYSFSTGATHLTVDEETGVLNIDEFVFAHDCGRALNRRAVEGQLEGSIAMGLGYAIYEHNVTKEGKILNPNFRDYRLPTALDMPKMRTFYDFTPDEEGPLGAKEAGEGSAAPVAPAIANAVNMATGIYLTELPLDPEHIWRAMRGLKDDRDTK
ncbi:MAG: xanthine dehydrogenase family protein molybdopterin-binding subunit [Treponema sp.]|jgi:CO/xanthine dehydrogenase Mo-binding subunit|nr:xanthine dehydrogenase family protein molybdopterin-binding subunit [Treponema sp.]